MTSIQRTIHAFFSQFAPSFPNWIIVDNDTVFPYIIYDFNAPDIFQTTSISFQIWDRANNTINIDAISDKIIKNIQAAIGTVISVYSNEIYEYYDPDTESWQQFNIENFADIAKSFKSNFPDNEFTWVEHGGESIGALRLSRGSPFINSMPINPDEREFVRYFGNIDVKSYLI